MAPLVLAGTERSVSMESIMNTLFSALTSLLMYLFLIILVLSIPLFIYLVYFLIRTYGKYYYLIKTKKHSPIELEATPKIEHSNFIKKLFFDLPTIYLTDLLNKNPNEFKEYGIHLFCGEQGSGKTLSMCQRAIQLKNKYPKCKIYSDFTFSYSDKRIKSIKEISKYKNGIYGEIFMVDEILTELSSKDSGNIPVELLGSFCQQRKERSCIFATAQVFNRVVKELREQTLYVYCPKTYLGCVTIVNIAKPDAYDYENQKFTKYVGRYWYVHTPTLRNCYDTYEKVVRNFKKDYNPRVSDPADIDISINDDFFKKGR